MDFFALSVESPYALDMSRQLHAANPEGTELHTFPGASHGISFLLDPERYERLIADFTRRVLSDREERTAP